MNRLLFCFIALAILTFMPAELAAQNGANSKRAMEIADLFKFKRVADPQLSPDGKWVAYQVTSVDLASNKSSTSIWLALTDGSQPPSQLTNAPGKSDRHPRWSPDGSKILFESNRSGTNQLWTIAVNGGEAQQITNLSTGAGTGIWSHDGKQIAFVSAVYPEFSELAFAESDAKNKEKADSIESNPVKARVFKRLFYRHWDSFVEDKRQHIFVAFADGTNCRDVTPGDRDAYPTSSTFSVGDDFAFAPDGSHLLVTAVPEQNESWSTNHDICRVNIAYPTSRWHALTATNLAADSAPRLSPDGKHLAYRAQRVAGYEADRWELMVVAVSSDGQFQGEPRSLTQSLDRSVDEIVWIDSENLLFVAEQNAAKAVFQTNLNSNAIAESAVTPAQMNSFTSASGMIAYSRATMDAPSEVYVQTLSDLVKGKASANSGRLISAANNELLSQLDLPRPEYVEVNVEGNAKMQMWILKPPGFDPTKKWPIAYLVHGGPQGAWEDGWSFRWCPQIWAAQGYVVALPNPRGSTGFGQKFVNEISGDWGGRCFRDLMAGVDYIEKQPWTDSTRIGAAGASFGGYMMNWFAVSTGRFKCLITHCSVWNFESMWGTTDELWFDEYEHGGLPWEKPGKYREFSPHTKADALGKYKTPMLVIHNDLDFRCPIGQGQELFTALQRQGVPSRFVNFPDEGHWVSKPANSNYWHQECFDWLRKFVPPGGR